MIDYNNNKKFFTTGGEFVTSTGSNYVGYVTCLSGLAFNYNTNAPLTPVPGFESALYTSPYLKNRDIDTVLTLPYKEDDVFFQPNDFITRELMLDKLKKLHENNTFVYSNMFMANNDLPSLAKPGTLITDYSYACLLSATDSKFKCVRGTITSIPFKESNREEFREIGNITKFVSRLKDDNQSHYTVFGITNSGITTLSGSSRECVVIENHSKFIESTENSLTFGTLFDIALSRNFIFITDTSNSLIYKYDVGGYFNGDLALANKRNLIEILGGDGPKESKNLFKQPKHITSNDKIIVINDSGNNKIKIFDLDFNFITSIHSIPQHKEPIVALRINEFYNTLYVFTKATTKQIGSNLNRLNLYIFNLDCYRLEETYKLLNIPLQATEVVLNVEFSNNNSDYYYVCTDRQVYKLFVSKPKTLIGRYQELKLDYITGTKTVKREDVRKTTTTTTQPPVIETPSNQWYKVNRFFRDSSWVWGGNLPVASTPSAPEPAPTPTAPSPGVTITTPTISIFNDVYKGIRFLPTNKNHDSVVFITDGRIYFFNEPNIFKQVIKTTNMYKFGENNMTLSSEEYIQASTINKELYKVTRDILVLKNNLVGRFTGDYDDSNVLTLSDYNYNLNFNDFKLKEPEDYYIHENEKATVSVINRALKNILQLQRQLVNLTSFDKSIIRKKELVISPNRGTLQIS
jgi:hypothetical protein